MDQNHPDHRSQAFRKLQQLQQMAQGQPAQSPHPPLPQLQLHEQQPQLPPQLQMPMAQQQQQQQHDLASTSQAEAVCRSLQFLFDSGMSKALLHQWVNDLPPQLQQTPAQSLAPIPSPTSSLAPSPISTPLLAPAGFHSPTLQQSPSSTHLPPNIAHPPLAPPAAAGPPTIVGSAIGVSPAVATAPAIVIKSEPYAEEFEKSYFDQASETWTPSIPHAPAQVPSAQARTVNPAHDSIFHPPPRRILHHGPRISVSSTSSASSGQASIWSANSAHSSSRSSWHSMASSRSMPSLMTPTSSASLVSGSQSASISKQNIYWCTSCDTSFKRKYDWKRHEDEFHERWRKYPCPEPGCNRCFWGSNSFNQHHKQSHNCKECPHADKVVKYLRKRKYWACGFCSALHPARERHVEHVARHFESGLAKSDWLHSRVIYGLLHQPMIHDAWNALVASKHGKGSSRRPQFSWNPNKTGRASGFIENESEGQLQDLLEFFDGDEGSAEWIVGVAYGLTDIVHATPPLPPLPPPLQPPPPPVCNAAPAVPPQQLAQANLVPTEAFPQQQDHRMSFPPLLSQGPQQGILVSPVSSTFSSSPYGVPNFLVPMSESTTIQQPSPDPTIHSPMIPSQAHLETRELPPIPSETDGSITGNGSGSGMMDFEYSSAPMVFKEEAFSQNATMADAPHQHQANFQHEYQQQYQQQFHQQQQQQQQQQLLPPNQTPQAGWGTYYFNDANGSM